MMNSSMGRSRSRYVGSNDDGVAVRREVNGSVSEDEGGILSEDMTLNMSSQDRYVKSGVDENTVMSIMESETGRGRLKIWTIETFWNFDFCDFFLWVERMWSSDRVRRERDADKRNML